MMSDIRSTVSRLARTQRRLARDTSGLALLEFAFSLPLVLNVQTHGAIMSEMFRDLMERPAAVSLPTLLAIARTPEHPYAGSARENLELLLGQNLGEDWSAWEGAVRGRLSGQE